MMLRARLASVDSPHTRGWTRDGEGLRRSHGGFPAHAGMDPPSSSPRPRRSWNPRTRGDGPGREPPKYSALVDSPHTRGWTRFQAGSFAPRHGFPAHAGMDPPHGLGSVSGLWIPRTRGDGPLAGGTDEAANEDSPHTRGWTGTSMSLEFVAGGFPAHAGMDPCRFRRRAHHDGIPRTRGDGPPRVCFVWRGPKDSPHTRGWTAYAAMREARGDGFPAHAGMDPAQGRRRGRGNRIPRTRGDGPWGALVVSRRALDSPHTRGWTPPGSRRRRWPSGFPAHAGMDPGRSPSVSPSRWIPRTRGDGPERMLIGQAFEADSPHTRGWTLDLRQLAAIEHGFPAHAGMDPC